MKCLLISFFLLFSNFAFSQKTDFFKLLAKADFSKLENQKKFFDIAFALEEENLLVSAISEAILQFKPELKDTGIEKEMYRYLKSEMFSRGYENPVYLFKTEKEMAQFHSNFLKKLKKVNSFSSKEFANIYKKITGSDFLHTESFTILDKASDSLNKRRELIQKAKKTIYFITWGYHDDEVGSLIFSDLTQAAARGVKVKVIADGLTASRDKYKSYLNKLKDHGIEVFFWTSKENPYYGLHVKQMIVDNKYVIEGGRNIGDSYLLEGEWQDTDIYYEAGCLSQVAAFNIFVNIWNEQEQFKKLKTKKETNCRKGKFGNVINKPNINGIDKIYSLTLFAIQNAKSSIEVANAYIILDPLLKRSLVQAIKRGVKVSLYTNSNTSVDEPIVSYPIMKSVETLAHAGAKVYIKQGKTLHSKYFVADNFSWIGSYNLHPRSMRYEVEKIFTSIDTSFSNELRELFYQQIQEAYPVPVGGDFSVPANEAMEQLLFLFKNQL